MFGLGTPELFFILIIVLLIYGPDRLPEMARKLGKITRDLKQMGEGVRTMVHQEMNKLDEPPAEQKPNILPPADKPEPPSNDGNPVT